MSIANAGMIDMRGTPAVPRPRPLICGHYDGILYTNWHTGPSTTGSVQVRVTNCYADGRPIDFSIYWLQFLGPHRFPYGLPLRPVSVPF